jgi:hypothetical protein
MAKKIRIYYQKPDGGFSSQDYPFPGFEALDGFVNSFELENGVRILDVTYFPNWSPNISGGMRLAIQMSIFRDLETECISTH